MSRTINASTETEMAKYSCTVGTLVDLEFSSNEAGIGAVHLTDIPGDITVDSVNYISAGHLLGTSVIKETATLTVPKVSVSLSGVASSNISLVLAQRFRSRMLTISIVYLDGGSIVGDPIEVFHGPMDDVEIAETTGDAAVIAITASSEYVNFSIPRGRHTSHDEQQVWFPGDMGFEFAGRQNTDFVWGLQQARSGPLTPRGGG